MARRHPLVRPETVAAHTAIWYVWAGGQKMLHTASMRGTWGWDAACKCGRWESRTGGATRGSVQDMLDDHRLAVQFEQKRVAELTRELEGMQPGEIRRGGTAEVVFARTPAPRWTVQDYAGLTTTVNPNTYNGPDAAAGHLARLGCVPSAWRERLTTTGIGTS